MPEPVPAAQGDIALSTKVLVDRVGEAVNLQLLNR